MSAFAAWLRSLPSLAGTTPLLDQPRPDEPLALFVPWLRHAAAAGTPEPHAATLATMDRDGLPDARTLILKDVGTRGWTFAGRRSSRKSPQLAVRIPSQHSTSGGNRSRAMRLRGSVSEASSPDEDAADLAACHAAARGGVYGWARWWLDPFRVGFSQGSPDRRHLRVVYHRTPDD